MLFRSRHASDVLEIGASEYTVTFADEWETDGRRFGSGTFAIWFLGMMTTLVYVCRPGPELDFFDQRRHEYDEKWISHIWSTSTLANACSAMPPRRRVH